jgi:hypothetical protein
MFGLSLVLSGLIGCGGGGGTKTPDSKIFLDAAIDAPPACSVACDNPSFCSMSMGMPVFPALRLGREDGPAGPQDCMPAPTPPDTCRVEGDWYITFGPDAGGLANRKAFDMFLSLSPQGSTTLDLLGVRLLKPLAGGFPTAPTALDPNPATAAPVAWSFFLGNALIQNMMIVSVEQEYYANMGSITTTEIGESNGLPITGSTTPLAWREIDMAGADVPGGCTATMGVGSANNTGFSFFLTQDDTPAFQASQPKYINGMRVLEGAELEAARNYVNKRFARLWPE